MSANAARQVVADMDRVVTILLLIVVGIGLVMVCSASSPLDENDPLLYLKKQAVWVALGFVLMLTISRMNLKALDNTWTIGLLLCLSFSFLLLVFVPGLAAPAKGSSRWIHLGSFKMQPSEVTKGMMVLFFAHYLSQMGAGIRRFAKGMLPMTGIAGLFMLVILLEPDMGGATMIFLLMMVMFYLGGAKKWVLSLYLALAGSAFVTAMLLVPYQRRRLFSFLHPWEDPTGAGYQIKNSLVALGRGGVTGVGFGNGFQKLGYLPEIHTDFILANLGEERGLIGLLFVFFLFAALIFRSMRLAMRNKDPFIRFVGLGAASLLGLQVLVNGGVVMCLLPTKGLAMPFLSYGGTSALLNFSLIGLILAAGRASAPPPRRETTLNMLTARHSSTGDLEQ